MKVTGMPSGAVIHWKESFVRPADELEWSAECQAGGYLKAVPGLWVYTVIGLGLAVYIRAAARGTAGVAGDLVAECGTYIDVFCGSGRAQVRDTRQLVDGSPIATRKCPQRKARLRPPRGRVSRSESSGLGTQLFRNLRARVSGSSR